MCVTHTCYLTENYVCTQWRIHSEAKPIIIRVDRSRSDKINKELVRMERSSPSAYTGESSALFIFGRSMISQQQARASIPKQQQLLKSLFLCQTSTSALAEKSRRLPPRATPLLFDADSYFSVFIYTPAEKVVHTLRPVL